MNICFNRFLITFFNFSRMLKKKQFTSAGLQNLLFGFCTRSPNLSLSRSLPSSSTRISTQCLTNLTRIPTRSSTLSPTRISTRTRTRSQCNPNSREPASWGRGCEPRASACEPLFLFFFFFLFAFFSWFNFTLTL